MPISKKDIKHIAGLARIHLSDKEEEQYTKELSAILDFIAMLKKVETNDIEPLYQTTGLTNIIRKDEIIYNLDQAKTNSIIDQFPERDSSFVKVGAIIEKNRN